MLCGYTLSYKVRYIVNNSKTGWMLHVHHAEGSLQTESLSPVVWLHLHCLLKVLACLGKVLQTQPGIAPPEQGLHTPTDVQRIVIIIFGRHKVFHLPGTHVVIYVRALCMMAQRDGDISRIQLRCLWHNDSTSRWRTPGAIRLFLDMLARTLGV